MWLLSVGTSFNCYSFCNGIIASGELWNYKYFLITVFFVKTKEMLVKKFTFFSIQFLQFSPENKLWLFKNRSRRVWVDQNDVKFSFCMKNCFLEFIMPLISHLLHLERHWHNHRISIQQHSKKIDQKKTKKNTNTNRYSVTSKHFKS